MKKAFLFFLLAAASILSGLAQQKTTANNVRVQWGQEINEPKNSFFHYIFHNDETGYYILRYDDAAPSHYVLEHLDKDFIETKSVALNLDLDKKKRLSLDFMQGYNGELYLFGTLDNRKQKAYELYVQRIDKNSLLPAESPRQILSVSYKGHNSGGGMQFDISPDRSKYLVMYDIPNKDKNPERFGLLVLDHELKTLWDKQFELTHTDELFKVQDRVVDNQGNVSVLAHLYLNSKKEEHKGKPNFINQLVRVSQNGNEIKEYAIEVPDNYLNNTLITLAANQDVICTGFYSPTETTSLKGTYYLSINASTGQRQQEAIRAFDGNILTLGMKERKAERIKEKIQEGDNYEFSSYYLSTAIARPQGGMLLVGQLYESTFVASSSIGSGTSVKGNTHYHYGDLLAVRLDPEGNILWAQKIAKNQRTVDDDQAYASYTVRTVNDKYYFLFNNRTDDRSGLQNFLQPNSLMDDNTTLWAVALDDNGNQHKSQIGNGGSEITMFMPGRSYYVNPSQTVIHFSGKRKSRLALVDFE